MKDHRFTIFQSLRSAVSFCFGSDSMPGIPIKEIIGFAFSVIVLFLFPIAVLLFDVYPPKIEPGGKYFSFQG